MLFDTNKASNLFFEALFMKVLLCPTPMVTTHVVNLDK